MPIAQIPVRAGNYLDREVLDAIAADWKVEEVRKGDAASAVTLSIPASVGDDRKLLSSWKSNTSYRVKNAAEDVAPKRKGWTVTSRSQTNEDGTVTFYTFFTKNAPTTTDTTAADASAEVPAS